MILKQENLIKKIIRSIIIITAFIGMQRSALAQIQKVIVKVEFKSDNSYEFSYEKDVPGNYTLAIILKNLKNAYNPHFKEVISNNQGSLFSLTPIDSKKRITFSYNYSYIQGIINPKVNKEFTYLLPFQKGKEIKVHDVKNLANAILDKSLPENWKMYQFEGYYLDSIFASRKGVVINIIDNNTSDLEAYYSGKKNSITIEHLDGSFANYSGFQKNSILVKEGQTVYPSTFLGLVNQSNKDHLNSLIFSVYYLVNDEPNRKYRNSSFKYVKRTSYINPYFFTSKGVEQLLQFNNYIADFNKELILREFTRREKKQLKKNQIKI